MFGSGGAWRSLVAHLLWEQRVGGSNPSAPTTLRISPIDWTIEEGGSIQLIERGSAAPVAQSDRASAFEVFG